MQSDNTLPAAVSCMVSDDPYIHVYRDQSYSPKPFLTYYRSDAVVIFCVIFDSSF